MALSNIGASTDGEGRFDRVRGDRVNTAGTADDMAAIFIIDWRAPVPAIRPVMHKMQAALSGSRITLHSLRKRGGSSRQTGHVKMVGRQLGLGALRHHCIAVLQVPAEPFGVKQWRQKPVL